MAERGFGIVFLCAAEGVRGTQGCPFGRSAVSRAIRCHAKLIPNGSNVCQHQQSLNAE